jgi:excisionase family DNA binding protein
VTQKTSSDPLAYTVPEFCRTVRISCRTFYILQQRGDGPPLVRIGRRVLIRRAAAEEWLKVRETKPAAA